MATFTNEELLRRLQVERADRHGMELLRQQIRYPVGLSEDPARPARRLPGSYRLTNKDVAIYYAAPNPGDSALGAIMEVAYDVWHNSKYPIPEFENFLSQTIVYTPRPEYTQGPAPPCPLTMVMDIVLAHDTVLYDVERDLQDNVIHRLPHRIKPMFRSIVLIVLTETDLWDPDRKNPHVLVAKTLQDEGIIPDLDLQAIGNTIRFNDNADVVIAPLRDALQWIRDLEDADVDRNGSPLLQNSERFP